MDHEKVSRRLSYVLRHAPESIGLALDPNGWVRVGALLDALRAHGLALSADQLAEVVAANDKQRFAFDETCERIRASHGHSVAVDLGYEAQQPPPVLYHGTPRANLDAIKQHGLRPKSRHAVHLSPDVSTATAVGARRGEPVVFRVDAAALAATGATFTCSANGVWLVDSVPRQYLSLIDES
jgi:putative RNA 2'-phosphotransferase